MSYGREQWVGEFEDALRNFGADADEHEEAAFRRKMRALGFDPDEIDQLVKDAQS